MSVWGPPSQVDTMTGMLASARSSIPKPVVPSEMMTRPFGAIPANVPRGTHLPGSSKLLCLLSTPICLLCPSSCPRKLIDYSSAVLRWVPLIGLAGLTLTQLIDSSALGSVQLKLMRHRYRRSSCQHR